MTIKFKVKSGKCRAQFHMTVILYNIIKNANFYGRKVYKT